MRCWMRLHQYRSQRHRNDGPAQNPNSDERVSVPRPHHLARQRAGVVTVIEGDCIGFDDVVVSGHSLNQTSPAADLTYFGDDALVDVDIGLPAGSAGTIDEEAAPNNEVILKVFLG